MVNDIGGYVFNCFAVAYSQKPMLLMSSLWCYFLGPINNALFIRPTCLSSHNKLLQDLLQLSFLISLFIFIYFWSFDSIDGVIAHINFGWKRYKVSEGLDMKYMTLVCLLVISVVSFLPIFYFRSISGWRVVPISHH